MRLSGLASGFDTESMVQQLMNVERLKVNRFEQQKQVNLWKQQAYTNMNKTFANFILNTKKDLGLNKISSNGVITGSSFDKLDYIRKASSNDDKIASATVTGKAVNGSFVVNVEEAGKDATFVSEKIDKKEMLKEDLYIEGVLVGKEGEKFEDVFKNLPKNKDLKDKGVSAFYDEGTGKMFVQGSGIEGKIDIKGLGNEEGKYQGGKKAQVTINGEKMEVKNNKINFNGLSIDIKSEGVTTINVSTNTDGIIEKIENFVKEYNKLVDEISGKVGEKRYPSFHPLSKEEKEAMTDKDIELWEEKAQSGMLNRDETLNKIAAGMRAGLYETVEGMPDGFKNLTQIGITTEKYNKGSVAGKLEIDTEKLRKALEEDPDAVMELLFKDTPAAKGQKDKDPKQQGVFTRVYDTMVDGMKEIVDKSGPGDDSDLLRNVKSNMLIDFVTKRGSISDLDKSILDMDKKIDSMNQLLARKEDSYYAQFTAMEKYVYKMNSQSAWIGQQMM